MESKKRTKKTEKLIPLMNPNFDAEYKKEQEEKKQEQIELRLEQARVANQFNASALKKVLTNTVTTETIMRAQRALKDILSDVIMNPDFDPDGFLANICYWYEFQQLAKSYGKKLLYFTPKPKKDKEGK